MAKINESKLHKIGTAVLEKLPTPKDCRAAEKTKDRTAMVERADAEYRKILRSQGVPVHPGESVDWGSDAYDVAPGILRRFRGWIASACGIVSTKVTAAPPAKKVKSSKPAAKKVKIVKRAQKINRRK